MNILVTGHTGFIGTAFTNSYQHKYSIQGISLSKTDIHNLNLTSYDCILHTSGVVHDKIGIPVEIYFKINVKQTFALAQAAKTAGVKHFIFMSSSLVYGLSDDDTENCALTENSPCRPNSPYGISKLKAEEELKSLQSPNFTVSIIRSPMVYGEHCKGNMLSLVRLVNTLPITPFKGEKNLKSFIYIGNLVHFLDLVVQKKPQGVLIPQDSEPLSLESLMIMIMKAIGKRRWFIRLPAFMKTLLFYSKKHIAKKLFYNFYFDSKVSNDVLNYAAPFSSETGVTNMVKIKS